MKEYKGLYHNVQDKTKTYEYGAHFKYSELYIALKNLQIKQKNENSFSEETDNFLLENENKEEVLPEKKRKKYKLKTLNINANNRYFLTEINKKDNEKDEFSIIEEEGDNIKNQIRKRNRFLTKSTDKMQLPKISSNSLISLQNNHMQTEGQESLKLYQSYDHHHHKRNKINFPKLNTILQENINNNMIVETQSIFGDKGAIKIYNDPYDEGSKKIRLIKRKKDKMFPKLFQLSKDNEEKSEFLIRPQRRNDKLKSIFEKEKYVRNNNLFLGEKNSYFRTEERDMKIEQMAQQIHNLKKKLLANQNKNI